MRSLIVFALALGIVEGREQVQVEVVDSAVHAVPDARATIYNAARVIAAVATTDRLGSIAVDLPAPGRYLLVVAHAGFAERSVALDVPGSVKVELSVRPIQEEITVTAEAGQVRAAESVAQRMTLINGNDIRERTATVLTEVASGELGIAQLRTSSTMGLSLSAA